MATDNRTIKELSASGLDNAAPLCIQYPMAAQGKTDEFELKSSLLHHIPKFYGLSMEDPNKHLKEFEVVCSSMTFVNVDGSILKVKAFPFSLLEKAKDWLYELAPETVTSWESMKRAFLEKFFPTSRVILLRKRISGIQQNQGESFPTYYERFKTLVASCPQHQMKEELLFQYFYEGLLPTERQMLDASAGGALVDKTPMAAKTLIANRALNAQQYEGVGQIDIPRQQHVNEGQQNQNKMMLNQAKEVDELKKQMGQMAEFMGQIKEQGKLPSTTIVNPRGGFESVKAITLRSRKEVGTNPQPSKSAQTEDEKLQQEEDVQHTPTARKETTLPCTPTLPNPSNMSTTGELKHDGVVIQLANRSNAYSKGVLEDVLVQVDHLIFPVAFYVLDMEDVAHSPLPSILLRRPFMKTAQTKIDVAKGALTMAFGGDMIHFKIHESNVNLIDVRSCFASDVVQNIGQEPSAPTKKDEFPTTNEEEIGVEHKEHTTNLQMHDLAESTFGKFVDSAVPNRIQAGGNDYIDLRVLNAPIGKDYYPLPFIEPMYEYFEEHVVKDIPLHAVGPIQV
ncbi:unnamed protein product [Malus baccata var. baccata]